MAGVTKAPAQGRSAGARYEITRRVQPFIGWLTRPVDDEEAAGLVAVLLPIAFAYVMGTLVLLLTGSPGGGRLF